MWGRVHPQTASLSLDDELSRVACSKMWGREMITVLQGRNAWLRLDAWILPQF